MSIADLLSVMKDCIDDESLLNEFKIYRYIYEDIFKYGTMDSESKKEYIYLY